MKRSSYASPYAIWMVMFTLVPLLFVVYFAFIGRDGSFTLRNFEKFFQPMYLSALVLSLKLAFFCTLICLLVGYPAAKFLASRDFSRRQSFVVLFLLPMWMNCLLRTYAWVSILEDTGIINTVLEWLGLPRVQMVGTEGAVLLGMVYNFLPFMILPIYTVLKKLDTRVVEAAEDLGANPLRVFFRVTLPLSMPGVVSGVTMVFMPAATTFAISHVLADGRFDRLSVPGDQHGQRPELRLGAELDYDGAHHHFHRPFAPIRPQGRRRRGVVKQYPLPVEMAKGGVAA